MTATEAMWDELANRKHELTSRERAAFNLAEQNAEDTSVEENFGQHSGRWFEVFAASFSAGLDNMDDGSVEDWDF